MDMRPVIIALWEDSAAIWRYYIFCCLVLDDIMRLSDEGNLRFHIEEVSSWNLTG